MASKWHKTGSRGVRYREHATRKHGINKDRYFSIYYRIDGKQKEEALGWASEGWTEEKAVGFLAKLKEAIRTGEGPTSLGEKRKLANEKKEREREEQEKLEKEAITLSEFFEDSYLPNARTSKKAASIKAEKILFAKWIKPVLGDMAFKDIYPLDLERLKRKMLNEKKSARTVEYTFATVRQIWNMARRDGIVDKESPTKEVRLPRYDNKRLRFLTHEAAQELLDELRKKSQQWHDIALLSLQSGLRAGEIFSLVWSDVDTGGGFITVRDPKSGRNRIVPMTHDVANMFNRLLRGKPSEFVFKDRKGNRIHQVSNTFERAVNTLGLNNDIDDKRQRIVFHSLRHSFASWLVQGGTDLYTVQRLMGHASFAMVARYSHLSPDTLRAAVRKLENNMPSKDQDKKEKVLASESPQ